MVILEGIELGRVPFRHHADDKIQDKVYIVN